MPYQAIDDLTPRPSKKAEATDDFAKETAKAIVAAAMKATGPTWVRLSGEGRVVECKAALCNEMLRDQAGVPQAWWLAVHKAVLDILENEDCIIGQTPFQNRGLRG